MEEKNQVLQNEYLEEAVALLVERPELRDRELPQTVIAARLRGKTLGQAWDGYDEWFRDEYAKAADAWGAAQKQGAKEDTDGLFLRGFDAAFDD